MRKIFKFWCCTLFVTLSHGSPPHAKMDGDGSVDTRIVSGESAYIRDYPYQVSLQNLGKHICGGAIISQSVVLTAAHCTFGLYAPFVRIRAGSTTNNNGGSVFSVQTIVNHDKFNATTMDYDISYIRTSNLIIFTTYMKAISLPSEDYVASEGAKVTVTGWGLTEENGILSPTSLRKVDLYIIDHDQCDAAFDIAIRDSMICATVPGGGKDTCQGDSGGPLALGNTLVGVVSWGIGCARPQYPGVYTNVAFFRSWIKSMSGV